MSERELIRLKKEHQKQVRELKAEIRLLKQRLKEKDSYIKSLTSDYLKLTDTIPSQLNF